MTRLTHSVSLPSSIAALRKVHSHLMLGVPDQLRLLTGQEQGGIIRSAEVGRTRQQLHDEILNYSAFAVMKMYRRRTEPVLVTLCSV